MNLRQAFNGGLYALILLYAPTFLKAQQIKNTDLQIPLRTPRLKEDNDKEGHYEVAAIFEKSEVNRGEEITTNVFFTGYGQIGLCKLSVYPSSSNIFDSTSVVYFGLAQDSGDKRFFWGADSTPFPKKGLVLGLNAGAHYTMMDSSYHTDFRDATRRPYDILMTTDMPILNSPVTLKLKVKSNAEPGRYEIAFYFTYFDGIKWATSTRTQEFRINSYSEEHSTAIAVIGVIIGIIGLIPLLASSVSHLRNVFRVLKKKQSVPQLSNDAPQPALKNKKK